MCVCVIAFVSESEGRKDGRKRRRKKRNCKSKAERRSSLRSSLSFSILQQLLLVMSQPWRSRLASFSSNRLFMRSAPAIERRIGTLVCMSLYPPVVLFPLSLAAPHTVVCTVCASGRPPVVSFQEEDIFSAALRSRPLPISVCFFGLRFSFDAISYVTLAATATW